MNNVLDTLKKDFNTQTIVLIPIAIVINLGLGQLVSVLNLPIFLDSIGTVLVAILAGPWAGALTGLITNLLGGFLSPFFPPFAPVAVAIGLTAGFAAGFGLFKKWWQVLISGIIIAVVAAIVATPIRVWLFGGITSSGSSFFIAWLIASGQGILQSVFAVAFLSNAADKIITAFVAWGAVKLLPKAFISRFSRADKLE